MSATLTILTTLVLRSVMIMPKQLAHALAARFIELRERENTLSLELSAYKDLLDLCPCPMVLTTRDGIVIYVNRSYCDMVGTTLEQVVVNGWPNLVVDSDRERIVKVWADAVASGKTEIRDKVTFKTPSGPMTVNWHAKLLQDNGYAIAVFHPGCHFFEGHNCVDPHDAAKFK